MPAKSRTPREEAITQWRFYRVLYNVLMLVLGVPAAVVVFCLWRELPGAIGVLEFLALVALFGGAANACFSLAPRLELECIRRRGAGLTAGQRKALFAAGMAFSYLVMGATLFVATLCSIPMAH